MSNKPPVENEIPQDNPARWVIELQQSGKHEKDWRKEGQYIQKKYRGDETKSSDYNGHGQFYVKNPFNILWSNTELLKKAVYARTPKPVCKPKFISRAAEDNSISDAAAQVLQRALTSSLQSYSFNQEVECAVNDALLPGRGGIRVRYEPYFEMREVEVEVDTRETDEEGNPLTAIEIQEEEYLDYEEVKCEYFYWEDFRVGPGQKWSEVQWIAFGHKLTREDLIEKFGEEKGGKCPLNLKADLPGRGDKNGDTDYDDEHFLDRAYVWEIWDKKKKKVYFLCEDMKSQFLKSEDDPLNLVNFFPIPENLQFIRTTNSMIPVPEYGQYQTLAHELDKATARIIRITDAIRVRGVYDSSLAEIGRMFDQGDNQYIPVENAARYAENGGFDRAIWTEDMKSKSDTLLQLYEYRNGVIDNIYQITGIADIMRGSSSAIETARAQEIKSAFGTLRLQDRQDEVARFVRDLIRLKAEVIAENFSIETLQQMTGLDYPTQEQKMMAMQALQNPMFVQQAPEQAQQMADLAQKPSWEEIKEVLQSDLLRRFAIDIETDSTLHQEMTESKQEISELLRSIVEFINGVAPMVQVGVLPMDAAKALLMSGVRRFKLGSEVEDALEKIGEQQGGAEGAEQVPPGVQEEQAQQQSMQMKADLEMRKMQLQDELDQRKHERRMTEIQAQSQAEQIKQAAQMQDKLATGMN